MEPKQKIEILNIILNSDNIFTSDQIYWKLYSQSSINRNMIGNYLTELTELNLIEWGINAYKVKHYKGLISHLLSQAIITTINSKPINLNEISTLDTGRYIVEYVKSLEDRIKTLEDANVLLQKKLDEKTAEFDRYIDFMNTIQIK